MKENGFTLEKARSRWYPSWTITDSDNTDDIALLANTPAQAESLLHSLECSAGSIGLHVNADNTEYMCFNQSGDISTLSGGPLKLVDKFTYLRSSISSTENDINTWIAKAWTAIDRLSVIWKSDLSNKIKCNFFRAVVVSILQYGCTTWTLTKHIEKKLDGNCTRSYIKLILKVTSQKTAAVWSPTTHLKEHPNLTNKTFETLLEERGQIHKLLDCLGEGHLMVYKPSING